MINKELFFYNCKQAGINQKKANDLYKQAVLKEKMKETSSYIKIAYDMGFQDSLRFFEKIKNLPNNRFPKR